MLWKSNFQLMVLPTGFKNNNIESEALRLLYSQTLTCKTKFQKLHRFQSKLVLQHLQFPSLSHNSHCCYSARYTWQLRPLTVRWSITPLTGAEENRQSSSTLVSKITQKKNTWLRKSIAQEKTAFCFVRLIKLFDSKYPLFLLLKSKTNWLHWL